MFLLSMKIKKMYELLQEEFGCWRQGLHQFVKTSSKALSTVQVRSQVIYESSNFHVKFGSTSFVYL